jgi:hypothetical protein
MHRVAYCLTSSARNTIDCGIARPSAFAALRLITISYFVGCSIGRSPGLAPFQILSTKTASRHGSMMSRAIGDQAASVDIQSEPVHGRDPAPGREIRDSPSVLVEEHAWDDEESAGGRVASRTIVPPTSIDAWRLGILCNEVQANPAVTVGA